MQLSEETKQLDQYFFNVFYYIKGNHTVLVTISGIIKKFYKIYKFCLMSLKKSLYKIIFFNQNVLKIK